jgi:GntR family transcriptional regulator, transcriptional repressor for pyruvate dehydrogenase complex
MSTATFEPVARRTISSEIRDRLLEAIRTGELIPGDPLPSERVLCQEFGVARTSVREAIQGLVTAGYLERRGNRPVVAEMLPTLDLSPDDRKTLVHQLFEVRLVIEPAMARLACERASDEDRAELVELAADLPATLDEFRATDRSFHSTIARASGNPVLAEVHAKALAALFGSAEFDSLLYAEVNRREVEQIIRSATEAHRAIAAAIARRDQRRTVAAVTDHLTDVERRMLDRLV